MSVATLVNPYAFAAAGVFDDWPHYWDVRLAGNDNDPINTTVSDTGTAATADWGLTVIGNLEVVGALRGVTLTTQAEIPDVDTYQANGWEVAYLYDLTAPATFGTFFEGMNGGDFSGCQLKMTSASAWEVYMRGTGGAWQNTWFETTAITTGNRMLIRYRFDKDTDHFKLEADLNYNGSDSPTYTTVRDNTAVGNSGVGLGATALRWIMAANGTTLHRVALRTSAVTF